MMDGTSVTMTPWSIRMTGFEQEIDLPQENPYTGYA